MEHTCIVRTFAAEASVKLAVEPLPLTPADDTAAFELLGNKADGRYILLENSPLREAIEASSARVH